MLKINVFNRGLWFISVSLGIAAAIAIGIGTYRQASPNLDSRAAVAAAEQKLAAAIPAASIEQARYLDVPLSTYNRDVLNSRLLVKYASADVSKLQDALLLSLKDTYRETALRPLAVREYAVVVAAFMTIFSSLLTTASVWVILCSLWYTADKFKQKNTEMCSADRGAM